MYNEKASYSEEVKKRFLSALRHHMAGWRAKVAEDFSKKHFEAEFKGLRGDPVYPKFGFDLPEYVLVRLMGRMSISIGRRLGEIYDKIPRYLAGARFNLGVEDVAPMMKNLELDIGLRFSLLKDEDVNHIKNVIKKYTERDDANKGIGIEIRYNFNPNDSSRLRKDCDMAQHLIKKGLLPIYLIYSAISPRDEAIARLKRAGWSFIVGTKASEFSTELFGMDLSAILDEKDINTEIKREVGALFDDVFTSDTFRIIEKVRAERKITRG